MIYRLTKKLAKKVKVAPSECLPAPENPFLDWTANLFLAARVQFIMVTNSRSLYSIVLLGKGITDSELFVRGVLSGLGHFMDSDQTSFIFDTYIAPYAHTVTFSKTGDRRVLGSMNDLVYNAQRYLIEEGLPLPVVAAHLNGMPVSMLGDRPGRL